MTPEQELERHKTLAEALRRFLEDTEDEDLDIDFLWKAWQEFQKKGRT